jgi:hypothetical protein
MSLNVKEILAKVVDPKLEGLGFERVKKSSALEWNYKRPQGDGYDRITFQKSQYYNETRVLFSGGRMIYELTELLDPASLPSIITHSINFNGFLPYNNMEELESILTVLADIIVERVGHPLFDAMVKTRINPPVEMLQKLSENVRAHAEKFRQDYDLTYDKEVPRLKQRILDVEKIIEQRAGEAYGTLSDFFVEAAAYLGELIVNAHGGAWGGKEANTFVVQKIDNYAKANLSPLAAVINYWHNPILFQLSIVNRYETILRIIDK